MGKKKGKLLMNEAEVLYKERTIQSFDHNGVEITYKPYLEFKERGQFIDKVVNFCVSDTTFFPELFDYAVRLTVIEMYSNITVPRGIKDANNLAYGSGLYESLLGRIHPLEINGLISAANEEIHIITRPNPFKPLIDRIDTLLTQFEEELGDVELDRLFKMIEIVSEVDAKKDIVRLFKDVFIKPEEE